MSEACPEVSAQNPELFFMSLRSENGLEEFVGLLCAVDEKKKKSVDVRERERRGGGVAYLASQVEATGLEGGGQESGGHGDGGGDVRTDV